MHVLIDTIRDAGAWVFVPLVLGGLGHLLGIASLVLLRSGSRRALFGIGGLTLLFALITLGAGGIIYLISMAPSEAVIAAFEDPAARVMLFARARAEALVNVGLGFCGALFPLIAGAVAIVRGFMIDPKTR